MQISLNDSSLFYDLILLLYVKMFNMQYNHISLLTNIYLHLNYTGGIGRPTGKADILLFDITNMSFEIAVC